MMKDDDIKKIYCSAMDKISSSLNFGDKIMMQIDSAAKEKCEIISDDIFTNPQKKKMNN